MKSLFPMSIDVVLVPRFAGFAPGRILVLNRQPELERVRRYVRDSSDGMFQKITCRYPKHDPGSMGLLMFPQSQAGIYKNSSPLAARGFVSPVWLDCVQ